jgi:YfiH family protein
MITCQALRGNERVNHGFFTRGGGVSEGVFASLNCGFGSGDDPDHVAQNRDRAMARLDPDLGLDGGALATLYQVHSADVAVVDEPWKPGQAPHADAAVTRTPGVALGILTADCAPVLFADETAGVIGAAHVGWRGALDGIVEAAVDAMCAIGAEPGRINAAIGPSIQQASYEVGPEFHARFMAACSSNQGFFTDAPRDGHFLFDLPGFLGSKLENLGLAAVETSADDTCADESRFFSHRRATRLGEKDYGRGLAAILIRE